MSYRNGMAALINGNMGNNECVHSKLNVSSLSFGLGTLQAQPIAVRIWDNSSGSCAPLGFGKTLTTCFLLGGKNSETSN